MLPVIVHLCLRLPICRARQTVLLRLLLRTGDVLVGVSRVLSFRRRSWVFQQGASLMFLVVTIMITAHPVRRSTTKGFAMS